MNALHPRRCLPLLLILPAAILCSCGSSKKKAPSGDAYASYPSDGRYNPYPVEGQTTKPRYQEYTEAPPPPPAEEPAKPKPKSKTKAKSSSSATASSDTTSGNTSKKSSAKKKPAATTTAKSGSTKSSGSGGGSVHVVKHGDTLYGLAKKYHTTVSKIKSANGLSTDVIRDGQKLKIP